MMIQGLHKRWRMPDEADARQAAELAGALNVSPVLARLLMVRGYDTTEKAGGFLSPNIRGLHPPTLLAGCEQAAKRIARAVAEGQRIIIYGDYDVDGITASAILWHTLTAINGRVSSYIPHRIDEGYGLNNEAIAGLCAAEEKPLIITVDCGITAVEQAGIAKDAGVDLIITDHHEFHHDHLPEVCALVHPRLTGEDGKTYPDGAICGAAVAFKLAWQVLVEHSGSDHLPGLLREILLDTLSLAALGTIADVVPLHGENRLIAAVGLGKIKNTCFHGLNTLIDASNLREQTIDSYHVGFVLGPRINAAGRMGHAGEALKLLTDADEAQAAEIAGELIAANEQRQHTQREIYQQAEQMVVEAGYDQPHVRAIVLASEHWHAGVVGIVASRLVEQFARPVVLLCHDGHEAAGSARSIQGFSIHDAFAHCSEHLTGFGGHAMAAGLRLDVAKIDAFRDAMVAYAGEQLAEADLMHTVTVDAACTLADLTIENLGMMNRLAPFGCDNPAPMFHIENLRLQLPAKRMGSQGKHLQMTLVQDGVQMRGVAWNMGDLAERLPAGTTIDLVGHAKINTWQGRRNAEITVEDLLIR